MGEGRDCALAWPQNAEFSLSLFHRTSNYKEAFSMEKQRFSHQEASWLRGVKPSAMSLFLKEEEGKWALGSYF